MPTTEGGDKDKMLNMAPASTKEPLRCLRTCPHISVRGDRPGRVSPAFPCHQGGLGEGGDSNDFVCTGGKLSAKALMGGCGEGSQSRSGDAAQTRGEAKGTGPAGEGPTAPAPGEGQQLPHPALTGMVGTSVGTRPLTGSLRMLKPQKSCRD